MAAPARRIGILAGGGSLPREIADSLKARGIPVKVVAIDGEADADFAGHDVTRVNWGQIGRLLSALKEFGAGELVIIGRVRRPDLWRLTPDLGLFRNIPAIVRVVAAGGDDGVLRNVVRFFEGKGFCVIGPGEAAPELVIGSGPFARAVPDAEALSDIAQGMAAVRILGAHDIGQAVVVARGRIEAVEGAEGTDAMLERLADLRRGRGEIGAARHGVLVKRSKPGQELRVDLPAIGPDTVGRAVQCGLSGIAVEAGRVLAAQCGELRASADAAGLFVVGAEDRAGPAPSPARGRGRGAFAQASVGVLNGVAPGREELFDARKGAEVLCDALQVLAVRGVVVARGYVLAVESGEGVEALLSRAAGLRQWGASRLKRIGVAVIADAGELSEAAAAVAARSGLAGIAVVGRDSGGRPPCRAIAERLRAAGLSLFAVPELSGGEGH